MNNQVKRILAVIISIILGAAGVPAAASSVPAGILPSHPRIIVNDFAAIRNKIAVNSTVSHWYAQLKSECDALLNEPVFEYDLEKLENPSGSNRRVIASREVLKRFYYLAFAAQIEENTIYSDRLWQEVYTAVNLPSWNPFHWLEVAEMMHAMAIAYDWCYDNWTNEQRNIIKTAIKEKGLNQAVREYAGNPRYYSWMKGMTGYEMGNNWTVVCNAGVLIGALAVAEEEPALSSAMINNAVRSMKAGLNPFAPDGGYREGVSYWGYAVTTLTMAMSALESAVTDFALLPALETPFLYDFSQAEGVSRTPEFVICHQGPFGAFNYGDASEDTVTSPAMFWFGDKFNKPAYTDYHINSLAKYGLRDENMVLNILWYKPNGELKYQKPPLDSSFAMGVASMRSSWEDDAVFVAVKGGKNGTSHQHFDIGTFTLDAFGKRWATMRGGGSYDWEGYFSALRDRYYVSRTEGQNTLVINPRYEGSGQANDAWGEISTFKSGENDAFAIVDMTEAYSEDALSAKRGVRLFNRRSRVVVQDEIITKEPSDVWWFMHVDAPAVISSDGRSAVLTKGGDRLLLNILSEQGGQFEYIGASPMETSPNPAWQKSFYGKKLAIFFEGISELNLAVEMIPVKSNSPTPSPTTGYTPLDDWKLEFEAEYVDGDVRIRGKKGTVQSLITLMVYNENGTLAATDQLYTDKKGNYEYSFKLPGYVGDGRYTVAVNGDTTGYFEVGEDPMQDLTVPVFYKRGMKLSRLEGGEIDVQIEGAAHGLMITALKDGAGRVVDIDIGTDNYKSTIDVPPVYDDMYIEVYLWNGKNSIRPVLRKYRLDIYGGIYC